MKLNFTVILLLFASLSLGSSTNVSAQADEGERDWTIHGQVLEQAESIIPITGASVTIKGTQSVTLTDGTGNYSVKVKRGDVLVFAFIGFQPYEHIVTREINNLNVSMKPDTETLEQVVVTGFTEEKKLNSIASIATLDLGMNLTSKPITNLSQALQGGVTGMNVSQGSGAPGADGMSIRIRGISSLRNNNDPLVLVDGIPMDMNQLDPHTIESITILKDAAAAAIYGSRAANGVIVVKTKRGMVGRVNVSYDGYGGIQKATYLPDFVNAAEYMTMANVAQANIGGDPLFLQSDIDNTIAGTDRWKYPDTDWANYLFGTGSIQNHSVSVSGGSSLARFALNVSYLKNKGLTANAESDRLNTRANTTVNLLNNLSVNMDFNAYRTNATRPLDDGAGRGLYEVIYMTPPNTVARYPQKEGSKITYYGYRPMMVNPAAFVEKGGWHETFEDNISINISPRWEVVPNLIVRGQYSYRIKTNGGRSKRDAFNFFNYETDALYGNWGSDFGDYRDHQTYTYLGGTAEYTFERGKHRLFGIAGYNQELTKQYPWDAWAIVSLFGKVNYTFDRRYLLEATVRRDGSSRFGPGNKYGVFPSIAAGWNVHEESFMESLKGGIDELKFRASYGLLGNENVGLYRYQTFINMGNGREEQFGNPNLTWEEVEMFNVGADLRVFSDLSLTFDWYDKVTNGMIINPPVPSIGGTSATDINSGKVRNRGWEISANYSKQITEDFGIGVFAGLSRNRNNILDLFGSPYDNGTSINKIGHPVNSHYVYATDGLLQESDFTHEGTTWTPNQGVVIFDGQQPGDVKYLDVSGPDGTPDGRITPDDRQIRGTDQPDLNYFGNLTLNYKNWSFEASIQGVTGVEAYYTVPYSLALNTGGGDEWVPMKAHLDYWTPENTGARYPRLLPSTSGNNSLRSDFWMFDAGFCRVKYLQLGYTFNGMTLKQAGISSIRVYVNAQNPFTFTKDNLVDPESRGQLGSYPLLQTYSIGLSLNL